MDCRAGCMRALALAVAALVWAGQPVRADEMSEAPCDTLHVRVVGEALLSSCYARDQRDSEGAWREELVVAWSETEFYVVSRAKPASMHTFMTHVDPRRAVEAAGLREAEDWGEVMPVAGYRAYSFTALPPEEEHRMQCLTFARNPPEIRGAYQQILGVFCRLPAASIDEAAAGAILDRIRLQ